MRKEFLLRGLKGENDMLLYLPFMTEKDVDTKEERWCIAAEEYDINPFGKLIKSPARFHARGHIIEHKKYYHGFFMNLKCTEEFYNKYKNNLDKYICTEDHINRDYQPSWM
tara:strand:- start:354 stop:686 length:333 start_codon:yes stop_codon:yes gene_type:complete